MWKQDSNEEWKLKWQPKSTVKVYIENTSKDKVLSATNESDAVKLETIGPHDQKQIWKKGPDIEGYFTLTNLFGPKKLLTAIDEKTLVVTGMTHSNIRYLQHVIKCTVMRFAYF